MNDGFKASQGKEIIRTTLFIFKTSKLPKFTRPWSTLFEFSVVWWRYTWFDKNHRFCRTIWRRYWILLRNCFYVKRSEIRIARCWKMSRYCAGDDYYVRPVVITGTIIDGLIPEGVLYYRSQIRYYSMRFDTHACQNAHSSTKSPRW